VLESDGDGSSAIPAAAFEPSQRRAPPSCGEQSEPEAAKTAPCARPANGASCERRVGPNVGDDSIAAVGTELPAAAAARGSAWAAPPAHVPGRIGPASPSIDLAASACIGAGEWSKADAGDATCAVGSIAPPLAGCWTGDGDAPKPYTPSPTLPAAAGAA